MDRLGVYSGQCRPQGCRRRCLYQAQQRPAGSLPATYQSDQMSGHVLHPDTVPVSVTRKRRENNCWQSRNPRQTMPIRVSARALSCRTKTRPTRAFSCSKHRGLCILSLPVALATRDVPRSTSWLVVLTCTTYLHGFEFFLVQGLRVRTFPLTMPGQIWRECPQPKLA